MSRSTTEDATDAAAPTAPSERIVALDALRGFALLGILVINIWFFSMPLVAAVYPPAFGDFTGANFYAWLVSHVFFEMKFITLFTLMFGAGIVLFTEKKARQGAPALRLHYRRNVLLLVIGLGHAYLLWYGDILVSYALAGFIVVRVRDWDSRRLVRAGLIMLLVPSLIYVASGATAIAAPGGEVEAEIVASLGADESAIETELETYRGGWLDQMSHRVPTALSLQTVEFALGNFWRIGGVMLLGMALFKEGILSNDRSSRYYTRMLAIGGIGGLALILAGVAYREYVAWDLAHTLFFADQFNYWGSLLLAGGYVGGIMLLARAHLARWVTHALAAVGRTAFSNYLLHTVVATTLFYGHGFGYFGYLTRLEQLGVVVAIWAIQIPLSVIWLRYFRFGPVEWVWRTLTYGERQPLRDR